MPPHKLSVKELHTNLLLRLDETYPANSKDFKVMKVSAKPYLKPGVLDNCRNMNDLVESLIRCGRVKVGDYTTLQKMVKAAEKDVDEISDVISDIEDKIKLEKAKSAVSPSTSDVWEREKPTSTACIPRLVRKSAVDESTDHIQLSNGPSGPANSLSSEATDLKTTHRDPVAEKETIFPVMTPETTLETTPEKVDAAAKPKKAEPKSKSAAGRKPKASSPSTDEEVTTTDGVKTKTKAAPKSAAGRKPKASSPSTDEEVTTTAKTKTKAAPKSAAGRKPKAGSPSTDEEVTTTDGAKTKTKAAPGSAAGRKPKAGSPRTDEEVKTTAGRKPKASSPSTDEGAKSKAGRKPKASSPSTTEEVTTTGGRKTKATASAKTEDLKITAAASPKPRSSPTPKSRNGNLSPTSEAKRIELEYKLKETKEKRKELKIQKDLKLLDLSKNKTEDSPKKK